MLTLLGVGGILKSLDFTYYHDFACISLHAFCSLQLIALSEFGLMVLVTIQLLPRV